MKSIKFLTLALLIASASMVFGQEDPTGTGSALKPVYHHAYVELVNLSAVSGWCDGFIRVKFSPEKDERPPQSFPYGDNYSFEFFGEEREGPYSFRARVVLYKCDQSGYYQYTSGYLPEDTILIINGSDFPGGGGPPEPNLETLPWVPPIH